MAFYPGSSSLAYQATLNQIQITIMSLQNRLLKRKQFDLMIQKQTLQQQDLQSNQREIQRLRLEQRYSPQKRLQQSLRSLRTFDPILSRPTHNQLFLEREREALNLDYIARLRALSRQQQLLRQQLNMQRHSAHDPIYDRVYHPFDQSAQTIAKKYYDGTRAEEYNSQLKRSADKNESIYHKLDLTKKDQPFLIYEEGQTENKHASHRPKSGQEGNTSPYKQQNKDHSTVKKYQSHVKNLENEQQNTKNQGMQYSQSSLKNNNASRQKERQHSSKKSYNKSQQNSPIMQSKLKKSKSKSTQPTQQLIKVQSYLNQPKFSLSKPVSPEKTYQFPVKQQYKERSLSSYQSNRKLSNLSPYEFQKISNPSNPKQKIIEQILHRHHLSENAQQILEIFYAKDVPTYLWTVYEKENKLKKQLKQKILKEPIVDRKFNVAEVKQ